MLCSQKTVLNKYSKENQQKIRAIKAIGIERRPVAKKILILRI